ncbi:MAG: ADP-ribose pyrophosphatase [Firmicutes bacterium HGW-Firmicutes-9]|jgi:ADP-ribose pyrophosphatase|nr:MAG: ADP-ribose pyrophosphatase [Firmicutes bacterium HGW-Firmicutes-9]
MVQQDKDLIEEAVSSEEIYKGKIVHLFCDTVRLPNGKEATREVIRHVGAAAVVPLTDEGNVILVRQYRYPFSQVMLEIPAGKLDIGEDPIDCAKRELIEETGYDAKEFVHLGAFYPSVAMLNEVIHLFLAKNMTLCETNLDEDEFLHVEQRPLGEVVEAVMRGEIPDGKTQTAILKAYYLLNGDVTPDKQPE